MVRFLFMIYMGLFAHGIINAYDCSPQNLVDNKEDGAVEKSNISETDSVSANWRTKAGIKASFIIDCVGPVFSTENIPGQDIGYGGALGGAVRFDHKSRWYVETGMSVGYVSSRLQMKSPSFDISDHEWITGSLRRGRISLPVCAGYGFSLYDLLEMNVNTGFEGSYTFAGRAGNGDGMDFSMFGADGIWRRWNLMYTIGIGLEVNVFSIEINGGFGLMNLARRKVFRSSVMNESCASVSAVYWFGL